MARATTAPFRTYVVAGAIAALVALVLAHGYRAIYLASGAPAFAEIDVVSTTLAVVVPALLASVAYALASRWFARARILFTGGILALSALSLIPFAIAPPHPGFLALAGPLHLLVGGTLAFGIPAVVARAAPQRRLGETSAPA